MPTGSERLVWSFGKASTLRAVTATIKGVKVVMAAAICWENLMVSNSSFFTSSTDSR